MSRTKISGPKERRSEKPSSLRLISFCRQSWSERDDSHGEASRVFENIPAAVFQHLVQALDREMHSIAESSTFHPFFVLVFNLTAAQACLKFMELNTFKHLQLFRDKEQVTTRLSCRDRWTACSSSLRAAWSSFTPGRGS